jgi:hypothetical protein
MDNCKDNYSIKNIIVFNSSDLKFVDGEMRLKRKYGKFTRPVVIIDTSDKPAEGVKINLSK